MNSSGIRYSNIVPLQESRTWPFADVYGPSERQPVLHWYVTLRNRHQAGQTRFAREQIIMGGEVRRASNLISDREEPPIGIVEELHIDRPWRVLHSCRTGASPAPAKLAKLHTLSHSSAVRSAIQELRPAGIPSSTPASGRCLQHVQLLVEPSRPRKANGARMPTCRSRNVAQGPRNSSGGANRTSAHRK